MVFPRVHDGVLTLPAELDEQLARAKWLRVVKQPDGVFLTAITTADRTKDVLKRSLGRSVWPTARRVAARRYRVPFPDGEYGVADHHPSYFLMPLGDREQYWATTSGYHEHLPPDTQDATARAFSERFAYEWLLPTGGRSFLEIGCGAGRNLIALNQSGIVLYGVDINRDAIAAAQRALPDATLRVGSVYDLTFPDNHVDVVFTAGVLMHVPHEHAEHVVREMLRIARMAVVHFELQGISHGFDFHRYPRDYLALYDRLGIHYRHHIEAADDGTGGDRVFLATQ